MAFQPQQQQPQARQQPQQPTMRQSQPQQTQKQQPQANQGQSAAELARQKKVKDRQEAKKLYSNELKVIQESFQTELKVLETKRYLSIEAQNDLREIKENLKNETWWHVSEAAELTGILAANISMHCDLILNLLEVTPGGKLKKIAIDVTKAIFESAIKQESISYDLIINILNETSILEKYTVGKTLISLTLAFKSYGENLSKMLKIPKEREALKLEVQRQLIKIEAEMYKYRMEIKKSNELINAKKYIIEEIDREIENLTKTF